MESFTNPRSLEQLPGNGLWAKVLYSCLGFHRDILKLERINSGSCIKKTTTTKTKTGKTPFCWLRLHSASPRQAQGDGQPQGHLHCATDEECGCRSWGRPNKTLSQENQSVDHRPSK